MDKGTKVTVILAPLEGVVMRAAIIDETKLVYLVRYIDSDGQEHERFFSPEQIVPVADEPAAG